MTRPRLIIFDLNKTLIQENSWLKLNLAMGVTQIEDDTLMAWGSEAEGIISDAEGQKILCAIYRKRGDPTRSRILQIISEYSFLPGAIETVSNLKKSGFALALISGSMDLLVEKVANEAGIDLWGSSNHLVFGPDGLLSEIRTDGNEIDTKLSIAKTFCKQLGITLADCMAVGDGYNDTLLFRETGCGVTFKNSKYVDLAAYTITNLQELIAIVQNTRSND